MNKIKKIYVFLIISLLLLPACLLMSCAEQEDESGDALKCKNLVLFIGDGMGYEHIAGGQLYSGTHYSFTEWNRTSVNTDSLRDNGWACHTTDSAAAGTAIATGVLTYNSYIGKDKDGNDLETILDYAKSLGKATGIVTSDTMYGATPAAFSAHSLDRNSSEEIITGQIESSGVDLLVAAANSQCSDKRNLIEENGYSLCEDINECSSVLGSEKAYCLFDIAGNGENGNFKKSVEFAVDFLSKDEDGFVLMVEQAYIDKYSHNNDFENMVKAVDSLNDAIEYVAGYSGSDDTGILVTADHETGNLSVSKENNLGSSLTGKAGDVYYTFESTGHSCSDVGLFVNRDIKYYEYSYYSSTQIVKNTDTIKIMKRMLADDTGSD